MQRDTQTEQKYDDLGETHSYLSGYLANTIIVVFPSLKPALAENPKAGRFFIYGGWWIYSILKYATATRDSVGK